MPEEKKVSEAEEWGGALAVFRQFLSGIKGLRAIEGMLETVFRAAEAKKQLEADIASLNQEKGNLGKEKKAVEAEVRAAYEKAKAEQTSFLGNLKKEVEAIREKYRAEIDKDKAVLKENQETLLEIQANILTAEARLKEISAEVETAEKEATQRIATAQKQAEEEEVKTLEVKEKLVGLVEGIHKNLIK